MMSAGLPQVITAEGQDVQIAFRLPTNISIAEESAHISAALSTYLAKQPPDVSGVQSLEERLNQEPTTELSGAAFPREKE